jgi:lipid A 3-O-deacylase
MSISVEALCGASLVAAGLALAAACPAFAGPVEEFRFGVMAHNQCVTDCDNAYKEDGVNLNGELVLASPRVLRWAAEPRPYVMASLNTSGGTSYGAVGLTWAFALAPRWRFEPGFGYAIHDADRLDNPYRPEDPRRGPFQETTLLLGSRDLFRTSLSLTREISESWGVQLAYEHLSHGQVLGEGRNQGLDEFGFRLQYRLGD